MFYNQSLEGIHMPVILRVRGFKFFFYEADLDEPPHVHIVKEGKIAKYWLSPVRIARTSKFRLVDLREIEQIIDHNYDFLVSAWEREQSKRVNR